MKTKKEPSNLSKILKKIAPKIGASILMDPEWGVVGQITFKNGKKSYVKYSSLDINLLGASEVAKDKDFANFFMKKMGYKIVPNSKVFFSDNWAEIINCPDKKIDDAYDHALKIGFPVIVKQNSGSQGSGVSLVDNKKEFYQAMKENFEKDRIVLVQELVYGKDYRIVVLDNEVIVVYERKSLNIIGDGKKDISELILRKQQEFVKSKREVNIKLDNPKFILKLKKQGLNLKSVLSEGERVNLLDNSNLSTGGDSIDVTDKVHSKFKDLAINLSRDMGLRLCGVDIMIDGDISEETEDYWILEVNHSPGFSHYSKVSKDKKQAIEDMYLEILKQIESK
ncbi:MAG: ATP-grasp domain-containing protein [Candidatus Paceibacterota bacterium]